MRSIRLFAVIVAAVVGLVSCSRDPKAAAQRYLESGNKYFARGKYKEARIFYRDALQKDKVFGEAYYRLGLTALKIAETKQGSFGEAVQALRRAVELLKDHEPNHWDAVVKLAEIYLAAGSGQKEFHEEVERLVGSLEKHDPNSWDAHRLKGDLFFSRILGALRAGPAGKGLREQIPQWAASSLAEYEKAEAIKPNQPPVLLQLARVRAAKMELAEAERLFRHVISLDKANKLAYPELYRLLAIQRKFPEAEQVLKDGFQANPKEYDLLVLRAWHYSALRQRENMEGVLQQLKASFKEYPQAYQKVGDFYMQVNDAEAALREYREAMGKDPANKLVYQKRIIEVLMRQGKKAEAAEMNSAILKEVPTDTDAKGLAATFLLEKGEITRALADLQSVVTRDPGNAVARYNLARAQAAHNDMELARQSFRKAIELKADFVAARSGLAQLNVVSGDFEAALSEARAILTIDRNNLNARLIESAALMGMRKFGESRVVLEALIKAAPNSPNVYYQLGLVSLSEKKYQEAEDSFRKSYSLSPTSARGLLGVVETHLAQNKTDQAVKALQDEIAKQPGRKDLIYDLAMVSARTGRYDAGIALFEQLLSGLDKNAVRIRADIYMRLGEAHRRKGDYAASIAALQKAKELQPENTQAMVTLGIVLDTNLNRWTEARSVYEAILKMEPKNPVALNNLAFLIAEHGGDLDEALTKATQAKQLMPNMNEVSDTLGWIYLKKNLPDAALDLFKALVQKSPNSSTFRYHLGMALSMKGDKPKAIKELQEALKYNPEKLERDKIQDLLNRITAS